MLYYISVHLQNVCVNKVIYLSVNFSELIEKVNNVVWGFPTVFLLIGCGIFYSIRLHFFQFSKIRLWLDNTLFAIFKSKDVLRKENGRSISQFQAVSTALAATIGTGNIAGVATAISAGGPGAVFWMWISACFGMMTSFGENVLGIYYRRKNSDGDWCGGPMYYIRSGLSNNRYLSKLSKPLSFAYSLFLIGASLGIGNMTQANAISDSLNNSFDVPIIISASILCVITFLIISGGVKRIAGVTEKLVPFMAIFYLVATFYVFVYNYRSIPYVFSSIFQNAFSFKAILGGTGGIAIKKCVSMGFRRGVFSNEAGLGASVTVNSCSNVKEPVKQGMWGIFQVFTDTIIVCTMTSFVLLSTSVEAVPLSQSLENISSETQYVYIGEDNNIKQGRVMLADVNANKTVSLVRSSNQHQKLNKNGDYSSLVDRNINEYSYTNIMALKGIYDKNSTLVDISLKPVDGVSLITLAFSECFGKSASVLLSIAIILFAFSTIIGWSFYGAKATEYIFGKKATFIYKLLFSVTSCIGAVTKLSVVWGVSDIFNGLMIIPNVIALFALSGTVKKITINYLERQKGSKISPMLSYDLETEFEMQCN